MKTRSSRRVLTEKRTTRLQQTSKPSAIASKRPAKKTHTKKAVNEPKNENDISGTTYQLRKRKSDVSPNASVGQSTPKLKKTNNDTKSPPSTKSSPKQSKIPDLFAKQKSTRVLRERTNQVDAKNAQVSFTALKPNLPSDETDKPATKKLPPWKCQPQEENNPSHIEDVYNFVPDANEPKVTKKKRKYVRKKITRKPNHKQDEPYKTSAAVAEPSDRATRNNPEKPVTINIQEQEIVMEEEPTPTVPEKADNNSTSTPKQDVILSGSFLQKSLRLDLERLNLNDARESSRLEKSFLELPQDEGLRSSAQKCRLSASLSVREQTYSELLDFELSMSPAPLDAAEYSSNSLEADRSTSTPRSQKTSSISKDLPTSPIAFPNAISMEESRDIEICDESKENQPVELGGEDRLENCFGFDSSSPDENSSRKNTPIKRRVAALAKCVDEQSKPFRLPLQPVLETLRANLAKPPYPGPNKSFSNENVQHDLSENEKIPDIQINRFGNASPEPAFEKPPRRSYEGRVCRRQLLRFSDTESESEDEEAEAKKKAAAKKRTKQSNKTKRKKSKYDKELEEWASRMNSHFEEIENVQL